MITPKYAAIALCFSLASVFAAVAQAPKGGFREQGLSFTAAQGTRGKAVYDVSCANCHGPDAGGGQFGPTLKGVEFVGKWQRSQSADLLDYIRTNMPPGNAGSLSRADYAAVTAHVLSVNGVAAGSAEFGGASAATPAPPTLPPEVARRSRFAGASLNEDATYKQVTEQRNARMAQLRQVDDAMLRSPPKEDWLAWRRAYDGLGHSPLKQIDTRNASRLGLAWSWALTPSLNESTPLVHDGVLFIHSGGSVQALDATNGDLLWQYTRQFPDNLAGGRNGRSKGMAIYGHTLYLPTVDGHVVALDARTGNVRWDHEVLSPEDVRKGVQLNGVPVVVKGKVMMGITLSLTVKGGCYIFALDSETGEEKWRFNTVAQPGQVGGESWNGVPGEQRFGGSQWTGGSYDPETNLIYFGVGNTYNTATLIRPDEEPGPGNAGLFTASTIALNPDMGKLAWHYQHMVRDVWDMDWVFEQSLVDMPVNGRMRKLVVTAGKMALFDAIDRTDGSYVFSRDAGLQNIVTDIDPKTGAKTYNPALKPVSGDTKLICPGSSGFRNWMSTAFNPRSHVMFVPMFENCGTFTWTKRDAEATAEGGIDQSFQTRAMPETDGNFGRIQAIDMRTGKNVWVRRQRTPISSSMLTTDGGVVFAGSGDRYFRAFDQKNGKVLWQYRLASTASSSPITYSVNGLQYVAVTTGGGNPQDTGWHSLAPEVKNPSGSNLLWVFRLSEVPASDN